MHLYFTRCLGSNSSNFTKDAICRSKNPRLAAYNDHFRVCELVKTYQGFCSIRFSFFSTNQEIGVENRLQNDLFCVEWGVKP